MPAEMGSEKFMRAERKNRLETHNLRVKYRHFDKATVRVNYDIDREKRSITKAFKSVVKTSGASDLGIPPRDEHDTDYEKCATYMQGLKLSNKRLLEWRECEKQLLKFIETHEVEREKRNRRKVFRRPDSGYTVHSAKKPAADEDDDVFLDNDSESVISDCTSPIDILKSNPADVNEKFDIKKWEKEIVESYKNSVCMHASSSKPMRPQSENLRSKSTPVFSDRHSDPGDSNAKRNRPHTAQPRLRPRSGRSLVPSRPVSANIQRPESQFLITKNSTYIKTGKSFEKLLDNRPVDKPVMVDNYLDSLKPPVSPAVEKDPSIASMSTLCPVQEGNEDDDEIDANEQEFSNYESQSVNGDINHVPPINGQRRSSKSHENSSQLKMKFQKKLLSQLQKARSAHSLGGDGHNPRRHFKHSNSDLSTYADSSRRSRRTSESSSIMSLPLSRTGSIVSNHRPSIALGIGADIDDISRDQDKVASEISAERPLSANKLVSISKVVRAAMTFSRVARKRCLQKMQEENSSDAHEIVRQERLRRLQSRQNVLNTITSQWSVDEQANFNIEQVD